MKRRMALGLLASVPPALAAGRVWARTQAEVIASAEFVDERDVPHRLGELSRPLLLVNLWANWCAGCLEEIPTIRTLASRLGADAIDVVLLSHAMNWPGDVAYARKMRLPFAHWRLSGRVPDAQVAAAFQIEDSRFGLPQTLVFAGRSRTLVASHLGSRDWSAPEQMDQARSWLRRSG